MASWLRVSVGTPEENDAFLSALDAVLPGRKP
jgi:histidinol-phosphate/aromatic aminotransferase/cobyric acid decarboxylase-like protein